MMFELIIVGLAAWGFVYFVRLCTELFEPEETFEEQLQHYREYLKKRNLRVRDQFPIRTRQ